MKGSALRRQGAHWLAMFSVLWLASACLVYLYVAQFEDTNAYTGIEPLTARYSVYYWALLAIWLGILAALIPERIHAPSDLFLAIYPIGTCLWSATYWPATRLVDASLAALLAALLLLPAALVRLIGLWSGTLRIRHKVTSGLFPKRWLPGMLSGLLILTAVLGYRAAGADANFDFEQAFLRRLSGRESFAGHALAAYLMQISMNGLAPLLAFIGGARHSKKWLAIAVGFAIYSFWLLAAKSPFLNVGLLAGLGHLYRQEKMPRVGSWIVTALLVVLAAAAFELLAFDFSFIAEFFIRRLALVGSTIQIYFLDAMQQDGLFALLQSGLRTAGYDSPEYFIGATYMGNEQTNANTNAYLHQLAVSGPIGYLAVVLGTLLATTLLDLLHKQTGAIECFAIAAMMGTLLIEQAFGTALISSGVGASILLVLLFSRHVGGRAPKWSPATI